MWNSIYQRLALILATMVALSVCAQAQSGAGSVILTGHVSGAATISADASIEAPAEVRISAANLDSHTVLISLSGTSNEDTEVNVPVRIRSNVGYEVSAAVKSSGAKLLDLLVTGLRPSGKLVAAGAVENLNIAAPFDGRNSASPFQLAGPYTTPLNLTTPVVLLSGPRASLTGTLTSPDNAVVLNLSARVDPQSSAHGWLMEIILTAQPNTQRP